MEMLDSLILWCSAKLRLALVKADLIPHLIVTLHPLSLSFTNAVDIHIKLMRIVRTSVTVATPDGLSQLEVKDGNGQQYDPETTQTRTKNTYYQFLASFGRQTQFVCDLCRRWHPRLVSFARMIIGLARSSADRSDADSERSGDVVAQFLVVLDRCSVNALPLTSASPSPPTPSHSPLPLPLHPHPPTPLCLSHSTHTLPPLPLPLHPHLPLPLPLPLHPHPPTPLRPPTHPHPPTPASPSPHPHLPLPLPPTPPTPSHSPLPLPLHPHLPPPLPLPPPTPSHSLCLSLPTHTSCPSASPPPTHTLPLPLPLPSHPHPPTLCLSLPTHTLPPTPLPSLPTHTLPLPLPLPHHPHLPLPRPLPPPPPTPSRPPPPPTPPTPSHSPCPPSPPTPSHSPPLSLTTHTLPLPPLSPSPPTLPSHSPLPLPHHPHSPPTPLCSPSPPTPPTPSSLPLSLTTHTLPLPLPLPHPHPPTPASPSPPPTPSHSLCLPSPPTPPTLSPHHPHPPSPASSPPTPSLPSASPSPPTPSHSLCLSHSTHTLPLPSASPTPPTPSHSPPLSLTTHTLPPPLLPPPHYPHPPTPCLSHSTHTLPLPSASPLHPHLPLPSASHSTNTLPLPSASPSPPTPSLSPLPLPHHPHPPTPSASPPTTLVVPRGGCCSFDARAMLDSTVFLLRFVCLVVEFFALPSSLPSSWKIPFQTGIRVKECGEMRTKRGRGGQTEETKHRHRWPRDLPRRLRSRRDSGWTHDIVAFADSMHRYCLVTPRTAGDTEVPVDSASVEPEIGAGDCSPFLNWDGETFPSEHKQGVLFQSLVATIKSQPALNDSLEAKAVQFLESMTQICRWSPTAFLSDLWLTTDEDLTDFVQSIVVLISSPSQVLTTTAMKMVGKVIITSSAQVRLAFVKAGLIPQIVITHNPLSISFTKAVDIHIHLLNIIRFNLSLSTPFSLNQFGMNCDYEQKTVHETVLKQVLIPSKHQQKWNDQSGKEPQQWNKVLGMLRKEGIEDVIEEKLRNDTKIVIGQYIVSRSIEWNNQLGMNLPEEE
ncbi:hypothetical protein BLNAU_23624 [Blattamonas nauphoetae]|uniref:Uncharacterized protein n=1 Tax=Blattamonas nauphoetae TaxID=2049346 RepID=A0ABQ9WPR6_9EUKA|nr:hypothetical protein BLNAU_23624 [Blattamonas nauphoetae]